ncbi:hypothetical protein E1A91_A13G087000v1 [Gossypium mustelinum]|uniref:Uncharacterized protein n=1 Tax=Gossypium mustelinum TaxID=34275 RepID=A0A5D2WFQ3_GOSMU|nr:hypothetical protein E1A91_A13G087000v1 [Gossypium mustelinum]
MSRFNASGSSENDATVTMESKSCERTARTMFECSSPEIGCPNAANQKYWYRMLHRKDCRLCSRHHEQ